MKKTLVRLKKVIEITALAAAIAIMIFTIFASAMFNKNNRSFLGLRIYTVMSDSMKATDFAAGDVIVVRKINPEKLKAGDIIAYQSTSKESMGDTVTHKIREISTDKDGNPGFVTYGTTTGKNDENLVLFNFVYGKYVFKIPKLGYFFQFLKTPLGYFTCILIPFLILITIQVINCVSVFKSYKKDELEKIEAERKELEEKRLENIKMQEEILALKEELAKKNGDNNG